MSAFPRRPKGMPANEKPSAMWASEPRAVTYRTGHGDFVFGRLCEEPASGPGGRSARWYYEEDGPVRELNGFKRCGPFQYEKLPLEIRFRILKLLVAPFYHYDERFDRSFISIELSLFTRKHVGDNLYMRSYKKFFKTSQIKERDFTQDRRIDGEALFNRRKETHLIRKRSHPLRPFKYDFKVTKPSTVNEFGQELDVAANLDWNAQKLLRDLANVSCKFRQELGTVFWTRVRIRFKHVDDAMLLSRFLIERPAIMQVIRTISLEVDCTRCDYEYGRHYISENLELEDFVLGMTINESMIKRFVEDKCITGDPHWLLVCRKLRVTRGFVLKETLIKALLGFDKKQESREEYTKRLYGEWFPRIKSSMLPDCLVKKERGEEEIKGVERTETVVVKEEL